VGTRPSAGTHTLRAVASSATRTAAVGVAAAGALALSVAGTLSSGTAQQWLVNGAWTLAAALAAATTFAVASTLADERDRLCWRWFAAASTLWLAGAVVRTVLNATGFETGISPLPAVLWQAAGVAALIGLARGAREGVLYRLFVLDAVPVVLLAVGLVQLASGTPLEASWEQQYLLGFASVYALLALVSLQLVASAARDRALLLVLGGFGVAAAAALVWSVAAVARGTPQGTAADVLWALGFVAVGLAGAARARSGPDSVGRLARGQEGFLRAVPPAVAVVALIVLAAAVEEEAGLLSALAAGAVVAALVRFTVARRDVAEQARALAEQNERLRELDALKDELISLVSHELRTPLTSIRGYLQLLREGDAGPITREQEEFLDVAVRNTARLERVVSDLLFVAQVDAGRLRLDRAPADLARLAAEAVQAAAPAAEAREVALTLRAPEPVLAVVDDGRIGQLLDNLVSNAVKFTPPAGAVEVAVHADGDRVVLEVADTGVGISAEDRARLFERFFRTSAATADAVPGTGLGLTISRAIVEAHGGAIAVESDVGRGTTVRVTLPVE